MEKTRKVLWHVRILGGLSLDFLPEYLAFPVPGWLGASKSLGFAPQGWETEAHGGSFSAALYLLSSLITRLRDESCSLRFLWDTIPSFNPC